MQSVKTTTELCKLLKDLIGTVEQICILVKFSPERKRLLEKFQSDIGFESDDDQDVLCRFEIPAPICNLFASI